jgi:uncharacterized protein YgiM (DUF1202 family)
MSFLRRSSVKKYAATLVAGFASIAVGVALTLPASLFGIEGRSASPVAAPIDHVQEVPNLSASAMITTSMVAMSLQPAIVQPQPVAAAWLRASAEILTRSEPRYRISATSLNIRSQPSSSSRVVMALPRDAEVRVLETSGSWHRIAVRDEALGWAYSQYMDQVTLKDDRLASVE